MKKSSLIFSILVVTTITRILFALGETTTLSIVEKMKAASHDFTLASELNAGQTDLKSGPLSGKKTGGIVTAEEYNRILELLSEQSSGGSGGTGGDGFDIVDATSGWSAWANGTTKTASCPAGYTGIFGFSHYYDTNSSVQYHGVATCAWNTDRTQCSLTTSDAGITEGAVQIACIKSKGNGGGISTQTVKQTCPTGTSSICSVVCPAGTTVIGGGVEWLSTTGTCHMVSSYPKDNGWTGGTSRTNSDTTSCSAAVYAICAKNSSAGGNQQSTWSVACGWNGWIDDTTHGGSYPEGGKGNTLSFYCASGKLTSVKWNKGTGTVDTNSTTGINCNYEGGVTIDPRDFHGGGDEIQVQCKNGQVIGMGKYLTSPRYSIGTAPTPGEQPTCVASLTYSGVVGYTCTNGKVTAVTK